MAKSAFAREEFDRDREFVVVRPFKLSGSPLVPGAYFDKSLVNTRQLRQFYDARMITMSEGFSPQPEDKRGAVGPVTLGNALPADPAPVQKPIGLAIPPRIDDKPVEAPPQQEQEPEEAPVAQPQESLPAEPTGPARPAFETMDKQELTAWLQAHGTEPRRGWGVQRLAFLANQKWEEQNKAEK